LRPKQKGGMMKKFHSKKEQAKEEDVKLEFGKIDN
jgi:hypothetical protein